MRSQSVASSRAAESDKGRSRVPELPRAFVDTRMPRAPAPGGRIISVRAPSVLPRKAALDPLLLLGVLAAAATLTIMWRVLRGARSRQVGV